MNDYAPAFPELVRSIIHGLDAQDARAKARVWAREHCTYAGGPIDFTTGRPIHERRSAA
ncbi:hypothetical protein ACFYE2_05760 [Kocuria sp. CPCC 205300]|uniref:hypothetical protein n=1 Tax=Kocuria sabuli TaxID=3071448 RepID=UPI0036DB923C